MRHRDLPARSGVPLEYSPSRGPPSPRCPRLRSAPPLGARRLDSDAHPHTMRALAQPVGARCNTWIPLCSGGSLGTSGVPCPTPRNASAAGRSSDGEGIADGRWGRRNSVGGRASAQLLEHLAGRAPSPHCPPAPPHTCATTWANQHREAGPWSRVGQTLQPTPDRPPMSDSWGCQIKKASKSRRTSRCRRVGVKKRTAPFLRSSPPTPGSRFCWPNLQI